MCTMRARSSVARDGDVRLGVEELGGAQVEVEEIGGAGPGPGAELAGVEGLAEAAAGVGAGAFGAVFAGDVLEEDGDAVGRGEDADGGPDVEGSVEVGKLDGAAVVHGLGVVLFEDAAGGVGEDFEEVHTDDMAALGNDAVGFAVEVGEAPVAVHEGDAVGGALKDGGEAVGGVALLLAGVVGEGDLAGEVVGEADVVDGGAGLRGYGGDQAGALRGKDGGVGVAEQKVAEGVAGAAGDLHGEQAAQRQVGEGRGVEGGRAGERLRGEIVEVEEELGAFQSELRT